VVEKKEEQKEEEEEEEEENLDVTLKYADNVLYYSTSTFVIMPQN